MKQKFLHTAVQRPGVAPKQFQINLNDAIKQVCPEPCGNTTFTQAVQIYIMSALISPNGEELVSCPPVFICSKCGKVYERQP